jgi:ABC-type nitrate/sulfonate/bicarbonate transport system permease component
VQQEALDRRETEPEELAADSETPAIAKALTHPSRLRRLGRSTGIQLLSVGCFLVLWQIVGSHTNPILLATPTAVAAAFVDMVHNGDLQSGFLLATGDLATGYLLAVVLGIGVGLAMGRNRTIEQVLNPYVNFMQATPLVALVPLIIIWLGIGFPARVAVVFILAFWSVIINTATGVKTVPRVLVDVARVYHLSEGRLMREIALPNAVPHIFAGLRIALGKALIGMVIAEMEVSIVGLGGLLSQYGESFKTAYLMAGIVTASLVGVFTAVFLEWSLGRFFPWVAATSAQRD